MAVGTWRDSGVAPTWLAEVQREVGDLVKGGGAVWVATTEGLTGTVEPSWSYPTPVTGDGDIDWVGLDEWAATTEYQLGDQVQPTTPNTHFYTAEHHLTSDSAEPTWPTNGSNVVDGTAFDDGGGYGSSATEVQMFFDVWAGDDLYGTVLGTLVNVWDMEIRVVDNGIGQGSFTVNRHDDDFTDLCATDNLVRVRLDPSGPFAFDDPRYKFAFFIEQGRDTILSDQEEGGENVQLSGRDAVVILSRAIIDWEAHHPFNQLSGREFDRTTLEDGQWHINGSEFTLQAIGTPGSVLRIFLRDAGAQTPNPLPNLSVYPTGHDFNVDHDSLGVLWSGGSTDWAFDVGTDLLTVLGILVNSKLYYRVTPALVLHAYENRQGRNLSGSITIEQAVNVTTSADRDIAASQAKSRMLVRGANKDQKFTYRWTNESDNDPHHDTLTPGAIEATEIGVRQGYLEYGASPTATQLAKAGALQLERLKNQHDGPPTMGVLNQSGQVALVDYEPGDTVTVDVPEFGESTRIHAITLKQRDTNGSVDPIIEFIDDAVADFSSPIAETKGGCCGCSEDSLGEFLVGGTTGSVSGGTDEAVAFVDPVSLNGLAYIPGTALVLVGSAPGPMEVWIPTESSPSTGVVTVTGATGDAYVVARRACSDPPGGGT